MSAVKWPGRTIGVSAGGRDGHLALAAGGSAWLLLVAVGGAGQSAATPPLGGPTALPPWDVASLTGHGPVLGAFVVTTLCVLAYLLGGLAVWWGLRAVAAGARIRPARIAVLAGVAVLGLVLVPPFGSADHLSYAAYGRIAAQGGDPYLTAPVDWRGGHDPVAGAAEQPWLDTTSVYGPVATGLQALASLAGGDSVRRTVWCWQLLVGACFLLTAWLLDRMVRADAGARSRVAICWTLNPVLLGALVGGAHLDAVSGAAAIGCLLLGTLPRPAVAARLPAELAAGLALGVAVSTKLPYGAAGAAVLWAARRRPGGERLRQLAALVAGLLLVAVPAHLWAGPHVLDQARRAADYVSLATPWRALVNGVAAGIGEGVRHLVPVAFAVLALAVLVALIGWLGRRAPRHPDGERGDAAVALLLLAGAYVLAAPYVLPWYDALLWAPLAVVAGTGLDVLLLARLVTLAIAYVPGRVTGVPPPVSAVMLGWRQFVAPWVTGGVLLAVLVVGWREVRSSREAPPRRG